MTFLAVRVAELSCSRRRVVGTFACADIGLEASDALVARKLELYLQWAESDERIVGFNPWHLMTWPKNPVDRPCNGSVGPGSGLMPKTLAVLQRIGEGIRNNTAGSSSWLPQVYE